MGYPLDESPFAQAVRLELKKARGENYVLHKPVCEGGIPVKESSGYPPIHSAHEGYAVILEELDEFWELVRLRKENRDPAKMLKELVQTSAMCQRCAEDLGLVPRD